MADPAAEALRHAEWEDSQLDSESVRVLLSDLDPSLCEEQVTLSPYTVRKANTFLEQVNVPKSVNAEFQHVRADSDDEDLDSDSSAESDVESGHHNLDGGGNENTTTKPARISNSQKPVGRVCCVPKCKGNYNEDNRVSIFSFPNPDSKRIKSDEAKKQLRIQLETWKRVIKRDWPAAFNFKTAVVCERHFHEACIKVGPRKKTLRRGTTPTIFPDQPQLLNSAHANMARRPEPKERREEQAERRRAYEKEQEIRARVTIAGLVERAAEFCSLYPEWNARLTPDRSSFIFSKNGLVFDSTHQGFVPVVLAAIFFTESESTVSVSVCVYEHTVCPRELGPPEGDMDTPGTQFPLPSPVVTTTRREGPHANPKWTEVLAYFSLAESMLEPTS